MLENRKGFTLIELLIVVVIIGILAAIAIPRFGETRERAFVSAMQSDINQARTAMEMCYQDGLPGEGDAAATRYTYVGCGDHITGTFPEGQTSFTSAVTLTFAAESATHYTIDATHSGTTNWTCSYAHSEGNEAGQILCVQT